MKKILAILATLGLATTASSSIISSALVPQSNATVKTDTKESKEINPISNKNIEQKSLKTMFTDLDIKAQTSYEQPANPRFIKLTQQDFYYFFWETLETIKEVLDDKDPVENVDFFLSLSDDQKTIGFWLSEDLNTIFGDTNWLFYIVDDISLLSLTIDLDTPYGGISQILSKIREIIRSIRPDARQGVDYIIPKILLGPDGKPATVNDIVINATESSNKLIGSFIVHLTKTLDLINNYPNTGSKTEGYNTLQEIINEIDNWYGGPGKGDGYYEIIGPGEDGNWTIKANPDAPLQFSEFNFIGLVKIDLSQLRMELDVDADNAGIAQIRREAIRRINHIVVGAREGRDYILPTIPSENGDGLPSRVGNFVVKATDTSNLLTGEFNIHLYKNLSFNFPTFGPKEDWTKYQSEIEAEVSRWNPNAFMDVDYTLDTTSIPGTFIIASVPGADVRFSFTYAVKISISDIIGRTFLTNGLLGTRENIEYNICKLISAKAATVSSEITPVLGIDYTIDNIVWDDQPHQSPSRAGIYTVHAIGTSEFFTGQFSGRIEADINAFINTVPKTGGRKVSVETRNQILAEINKWYPRSIEENRITVTNNIDALGSWRIVANPNSFVRFNEFNFTVEEAPKWDLGDIDVNGLIGTFYIDKVGEAQATRSYIQQKVQAAIATLAPNAVLGTDYDIQAISYDAQGMTTKAGQYVVAAHPSSKFLKGFFCFNVVKWLDLDAIVGSVHHGTTATGEAIQDKLIAEILKWDENAGEYFTIITDSKNNSWTISLDDFEGITSAPMKYVEFNPFTFNEVLSIESLNQKLTFSIGFRGSIQVFEKDIVDAVNGAIYSISDGKIAVQYNVDWQFNKPFKIGVDGNIITPGLYSVIAKDTSNKIIGSFQIVIQGSLIPFYNFNIRI